MSCDHLAAVAFALFSMSPAFCNHHIARYRHAVCSWLHLQHSVGPLRIPTLCTRLAYTEHICTEHVCLAPDPAFCHSAFSQISSSTALKCCVGLVHICFQSMQLKAAPTSGCTPGRQKMERKYIHARLAYHASFRMPPV